MKDKSDPASKGTRTLQEAMSVVSRAQFLESHLIPFSEHGEAFIQSLRQEQSEAQRLAGSFEKIGNQIHRPRIEYLNSISSDIDESIEFASAIVKRAWSEESLKNPTEEHLTAISRESIQALAKRVDERRWANQAIQGHLVAIDDNFVVKNGANALNSVRLEILQRINSVIGRDGNNILRTLWVHMDGDGAIWIYHHQDVQKWKCIYARVDLRPLFRDLKVEVEYYIPYGFGDDPGNYKFEISDCYVRTGWSIGDIETIGYQTSRTRTTATTDTRGTTSSSSIGEQVTDSISSGESYGRGASGLALNWSTSFSRGKSVSRGKNKQSTEAASEQTATSKSTADTEGNTYSRVRKAWGIDYSQPPEVHLKQWEHGHNSEGTNTDAARVFRDLRSLLAEIMSGIHVEGRAEAEQLSEAIQQFEQTVAIEPAFDSIIGRKMLEAGGMPVQLQSSGKNTHPTESPAGD